MFRKVYSSRQLRPENQKPMKKGLLAQLECLRTKEQPLAPETGKPEIEKAQEDAQSKATDWISVRK